LVDGNERFIDSDGTRRTLRDALALNYEAVFRFLRKLSGNEETARDLAQETMVRAVLGIRKFRGSSSFRTWLIAIAANLYRDGLRKKKTLSLEETADMGDEGRTAEREAKKLDAERAWELAGALSLKKRKALVLRLEFGYSYEEIARILSCPLGTVRSRIHEAIRELRGKMGEDNG
jgi:RNA polymerase sigma-70 factor, ECF subfamily